MKVYLSSTFEDLREHRAATTQALRQLGHEVVAMEDYVAESSVPLTKVLEDVQACDVLVEIVAWRYGYVPNESQPPNVPGAIPGKTSITEYEYRKAVQEKKPVLAFLLDERAPWPAHHIDGVREPRKAGAIRAFRSELQQQRLVAFFTTSDSLAARVSASVGAVGMRREFRRQLVAPWSKETLPSFTAPAPLSTSHIMPLVDLVAAPTPALAVRIDLSTIWWSTRLYLLAAVGQKLGDLRRIVIVHKENECERFVGMASASAVRSALRRVHPQAEQFESGVLSRAPGPDVRATAEHYLTREWNALLPSTDNAEESIALKVNLPNLRLWLGETFLERPISLEDLELPSPIDLLRILDYPNDFVPVVGRTPSGENSVRLVNKKDLSDSLARNAIVEMLDRLGLR